MLFDTLQFDALLFPVCLTGADQAGTPAAIPCCTIPNLTLIQFIRR